MTKTVIFSIDSFDSPRVLEKFLHLVNTKIAMQQMQGTIITCLGSYARRPEVSFIMGYEDFMQYVVNSGYVDGQESFMVVEKDHKDMSLAYLYFQHTGTYSHSKRLREVSAEEALALGDWTYRPDMNKYWVM